MYCGVEQQPQLLPEVSCCGFREQHPRSDWTLWGTGSTGEVIPVVISVCYSGNKCLFIDGFLCNVIADMRAQPGGRKRDICDCLQARRKWQGVVVLLTAQTGKRMDGNWIISRGDLILLPKDGEDYGSRPFEGRIGVPTVLKAARVCAAPTSCLVRVCLLTWAG